jgi:hypothetical protein
MRCINRPRLVHGGLSRRSRVRVGSMPDAPGSAVEGLAHISPVRYPCGLLMASGVENAHQQIRDVPKAFSKRRCDQKHIRTRPRFAQADYHPTRESWAVIYSRGFQEPDGLTCMPRTTGPNGLTTPGQSSGRQGCCTTCNSCGISANADGSPCTRRSAPPPGLGFPGFPQ